MGAAAHSEQVDCVQIRRPAAYYAPLVDKEKQPLSLEAGALLCSKTAQTGASAAPNVQALLLTGSVTQPRVSALAVRVVKLWHLLALKKR
jgi:hypothetical protein